MFYRQRDESDHRTQPRHLLQQWGLQQKFLFRYSFFRKSVKAVVKRLERKQDMGKSLETDTILSPPVMNSAHTLVHTHTQAHACSAHTCAHRHTHAVHTLVHTHICTCMHTHALPRSSAVSHPLEAIRSGPFFMRSLSPTVELT